MDTPCGSKDKGLIHQHLTVSIFMVSIMHFQELWDKYEKGMTNRNLEVFFFTKEMGRENIDASYEKRKKHENLYLKE